VSLLWIGGRIAQSALSGEPFLRPEIFSLLPLPRRRLGWSLMAIGLLDPVNALAAIALGAVLVHGIRLGLAAAVTAACAVALTVAAGSVLSTVAAGMLGPGSRRGRDTLDAAGNPTPAWSLKVHVALVAVALTALPTVLVLVAGGGWLAVPAGILTGTVLAAWLGRLAATRLNEHQVGILHTLATAA
jgi:ABC-2 type transport system permease protein